MQVHHHKDLCVTDQEIDIFKNRKSSQMSHQIQHLQKEGSPSPCMNLWAVQDKQRKAVQDKQRKQVLQPLHLILTNQEVSVFMCRKNCHMIQRIKDLLMKDKIIWSLYMYCIEMKIIMFLRANIFGLLIC